MYSTRNYVPLALTKQLRTIAMDPYEQQLLNVFESYDLDHTGSLDRNALTQLCQTLQLEEQTSELIDALLPDWNKSSAATFGEFKEALLAILGNLQNSNKNHNTELDNNSPEREVSPKLVYGSKRYGRRSKPKLDTTPTKQQNDMNFLNKTTNVQRSNSQCETLSKKRKSLNAKVKRCTSFPGNDSHRPIESSSGDEQQLQHCICTEEMLREAWKNLGVGTDGSLNQTELILVCDAIGLRQLANGVLRQLSDKLMVDYNHKISFQELLEILQQDDTWSDLLNPPQLTNKHTTDSLPKTSSSCILTITDDDSANFAQRHISLGPDGSGFINTDLLLDLWETAGISNPKSLLNNLGFTEHTVNVSQLAKILDKEVKTINDSNIATTRYDDNEQRQQALLLLQATVALYQTEIRCAKQILGQVRAERDKLRADVGEANNRAALLAHEVDDNHAKMERNVQRQIQAMEQKHADVLRQVSEQLNADKEHISTLNQTLQQKIDYLEIDELKLRNELKSVQNYANSLEVDNKTMVLQIGELNNTKQSLSEQVVQLESEKMDGEAALKLEAVLAQLSALHVKNSQLRDRNDEILAENQSLTREISTLRGLNNRKRDSVTNMQPIIHSNNDVNSLGDQKSLVYLEDISELDNNSVPTEIKNFVEINDENISNLNLLLHKTKLFIVTLLNDVKNKKLAADLEVDLVEFLNNFEVTFTHDEITKLHDHCAELELCIEQLRNEYERCEDYWSAKLDDERTMFEREQNQHSDKLTALMSKLTEFEAQYNRLPVIDEKAPLEKQYTDLEEEYERFKRNILAEIDEKNTILSGLLAQHSNRTTQTHPTIQHKLSLLSRHSVESTNVFPDGQRADVGGSVPCRPRRTRKWHGGGYNKSGDVAQRAKGGACVVAVGALHGLQVRVCVLEQRCRYLQGVVRQQHWQQERLSQYYCQQHRSEKAEYHYSLKIVQEQFDYQLRLCNDHLDKLSKADFLAKDLFVENAYLLAKVERLQSQCHLFSASFTNECSSV